MFQSLTRPEVLKQERRIADRLTRNYPGVRAIFDYGSTVLNLDHQGSDFDLLVIRNNQRRPQRIDVKTAHGQASVNFISLKDLQADVRGAFGHYFISKIITPFNAVGDPRTIRQVHRLLSDFIIEIAEQVMPSGRYPVQKFVRSFYRHYCRLNIFYAYHTERWNRRVWKQLDQAMLAILRPRIRAGKIRLQRGSRSRQAWSLFQAAFLMRWVAYGVRLRGPRSTSFPDIYIDKRLTFLRKRA